MRLDLTMLRTRVARRMLALFLISAVVPIVVFALVSYRLGATRLEQDARTELRRQSKADGQVLLERIRTMARELAFSRGADMIRDPGFAPAPGESTAPQRTRFKATAMQVDSGLPAAVKFFPALDDQQREHLRKGLTLLVTGNEDDRRWVALITPLGEPGSDLPRLWGVLDPLHLVADPSGNEEDTEFEPGTCLLDGIGAILHCPDTEVAAKLHNLASTGTTAALWEGQAVAKLTAQSPIFLAYDFAAPAWNLSLTRPASVVLAPLTGYRRLILLGVALAVLLVFFISHVQIRRSMTPLADLEAATRRLRVGDFSTRVSVTSTDEFKSLADSFNGMASDIEQLVTELDALSLGAMTALARTIDAASPWTAGHSERVTQVAVELATRLGLDMADRVRIQQGGLLHDIGKIGIPQAILDKPAKLTDAEMAVMRTHPVVGAEIIGAIGAFRDLVPLVRYHHELLDGSGYPSGLHGGQIPTIVRILTVADVFDALVSERPYRAGLGRAEALRILEEGSGVKFDEGVVGALRTLIADDWSPDVPLATPNDETIYEDVAVGAS